MAGSAQCRTDRFGCRVECRRIGTAIDTGETELADGLEADDVHVGVGYLVTGDHHTDSSGREGGVDGASHGLGHLPESLVQIGRAHV